MRKLASIVTIKSVSPIPEADRLEVVEMDGKGWRVVVAKDSFHAGDRAVYFEIDSYIPADDERFSFLRERCLRRFCSKSGSVLREGYRIKTIKLRGVVSQGLLVPASEFPEVDGMSAGDDATEVLRVEHYDEVAEAMRPAIGGGNPISADAMSSFPSLIPKTDEERIQNLSGWFDKMRGRKFEVTEKMDGSSVTMFYSPEIDADTPFGVCSRNLRLKAVKTDGTIPVPWRMAQKYNVIDKLQEWCNGHGSGIALQGELVGPGVNGNKDGRTDYEWRVFRIWDVPDARFIQPDAARALCARLEIPYVPVLDECLAVFDEFGTVDEILAYADGKTARGNEREGVVFKTCDAGPFASFKAVSNRYLLKQKD